MLSFTSLFNRDSGANFSQWSFMPCLEFLSVKLIFIKSFSLKVSLFSDSGSNLGHPISCSVVQGIKSLFKQVNRKQQHSLCWQNASIYPTSDILSAPCSYWRGLFQSWPLFLFSLLLGLLGTVDESVPTFVRICIERTWMKSILSSISQLLTQVSPTKSPIENIVFPNFAIDKSQVSIIGFPFLVMGICYSLIYYQVRHRQQTAFMGKILNPLMLDESVSNQSGGQWSCGI